MFPHYREVVCAVPALVKLVFAIRSAFRITDELLCRCIQVNNSFHPTRTTSIHNAPLKFRRVTKPMVLMPPSIRIT